MTNNVFKNAQTKAMNNGQVYHLAAVLVRNNHTVRIGTNQDKTHPRFLRRYADGSESSQLHAEMDVLRFSKPGDEIYVMRFSKEGKLTMSRPCRHCRGHMKEAGIKKIHYTDWDGVFVTEKI